mgnify:CR=1 FL=1
METKAIVKLKTVAIHQRDQLVLKDINLEIKKGEFVYLIGRTGSGKSSLLKALYADLEPTGSHAEVVGYDLKNLKNKEIPFLRRRLGIVFQDFQLLTDRTVRDNLLFVLKATGWKDKDDIDKRIFEVLKKVNMQTKDFKMPHELSGGEQQRIAIARALLNDPELILADEPTGNLDPETSHEIMTVLAEIGKSGRAVLMATHDHNLLRDFPARTLLCKEESIFEGDHQNKKTSEENEGKNTDVQSFAEEIPQKEPVSEKENLAENPSQSEDETEGETIKEKPVRFSDTIKQLSQKDIASQKEEHHSDEN